MSDLIDRNKAILHFADAIKEGERDTLTFTEIVTGLHKVPVVRSSKYGYWKNKRATSLYGRWFPPLAECSECGTQGFTTEYCGRCGAEMRDEKRNEDTD